MSFSFVTTVTICRAPNVNSATAERSQQTRAIFPGFESESTTYDLGSHGKVVSILCALAPDKTQTFKILMGDFPGGPVVKNLPFDAGDGVISC